MSRTGTPEPDDYYDSDTERAGPASLRPARQKALDRLARACWYLRPTVAIPVLDDPALHQSLKAFGFGVFGHSSFSRKLRIQRQTQTSTLGMNNPDAYVRRDRYIEVSRLLDGTLVAMREADDMDEEIMGLEEVMEWFDVQGSGMWSPAGGSSSASVGEREDFGDESEDEGMGMDESETDEEA